MAHLLLLAGSTSVVTVALFVDEGHPCLVGFVSDEMEKEAMVAMSPGHEEPAILEAQIALLKHWRSTNAEKPAALVLEIFTRDQQFILDSSFEEITSPRYSYRKTDGKKPLETPQRFEPRHVRQNRSKMSH